MNPLIFSVTQKNIFFRFDDLLINSWNEAVICLLLVMYMDVIVMHVKTLL